ncbi:hypothetical protein GCM10009647_053330 [Streptomyces sanglieri]
MRQKFVEHMRAWTVRRKILAYLIAQSILLVLIIMTVRALNADVPSLACLGPWPGAVAGGLFGILRGPRKPSL